MNKYYMTISVGGDPDRAAFLSRDLDETLKRWQSDGWIIERITEVPIEKAWSYKEQKYVKFLEYIIVVYRQKEDCSVRDKR